MRAGWEVSLARGGDEAPLINSIRYARPSRGENGVFLALCQRDLTLEVQSHVACSGSSLNVRSSQTHQMLLDYVRRFGLGDGGAHSGV
jgi:hypothetical protein